MDVWKWKRRDKWEKVGGIKYKNIQEGLLKAKMRLADYIKLGGLWQGDIWLGISKVSKTF